MKETVILLCPSTQRLESEEDNIFPVPEYQTASYLLRDDLTKRSWILDEQRELAILISRKQID